MRTHTLSIPPVPDTARERPAGTPGSGLRAGHPQSTTTPSEDQPWNR